jgi:DNA-binding response OmpR family regulator
MEKLDAEPKQVLLIEDDLIQANLISKILSKTDNNFEINSVPVLSMGLERLEEGTIDLIILDPGLPDSQGLDTFFKIYKKIPELPIVVLTGLADE